MYLLSVLFNYMLCEGRRRIFRRKFRGSSGGTYHYNNESNYTDDESGGWSQTIVGWMAMACFAGAGTIAFHCYIQKAKYKSLQKMKKFEKPGEDWNAKEMQKYVENAYFVIQECWRLLDSILCRKVSE